MRKVPQGLPIFVLSFVTAGLAITACSFEEPTIEYQDEVRPVTEVEEIIADQLEAENPGLDIEVTITEEVD